MPFHHRRWRFHGLKKPKIRQDWNKHTLYNLSRLTKPSTADRTFFQQKWTAKASTRAYHGEQIKETHWKRMFDRRTPAVVPMDPKALASDDGSKYSAGRGSGKQQPPREDGRGERSPEQMPYMQMVYHPTERRLDTAIFRALFASSARQARQFVTHGHVRVNGKKMIYPGYLLNPGDMFQVDPDSVLTSTGKILKRDPNQRSITTKPSPAVPAAPIPSEAPTESPSSQTQTEEQEQIEDDLTEEESTVAPSDPAAATKKTLLSLRKQAVDLEANPPAGKKLSAKQKQDLRAFRKTLKSSISRASNLSASTLDDLASEWTALSARLQGHEADEEPAAAPASTSVPTTAQDAPTPAGRTRARDDEHSSTSPLERELAAAQQLWTPKPYMSAFAFIPRYLEVNHAVCSAVYLRHPVVKPGLAEVPTPFHYETGQLSFNWYLRRR